MAKYTVGSFFAGVGGFDKSFEDAGYEVKWAVEWDKNCQHVLRRHFPNTKLYGDITAVQASDLEPVDVITWGFPCQDVSHAGKRKGLIDQNGNLTRSGLFYVALDLIVQLNPRVHIFENVTGLLSSGRKGFKGEDFEGCLEALDKSGFHCTWITLDSRFFGLAQRRRRIFGLCTRKAEPGIAQGYVREIFSKSKSMPGNPPPRGKTRKKITGDAGTGSEGESGIDGTGYESAIQLGFDFGFGDDGGESVGGDGGLGGLGGDGVGIGGGDGVGGGVNGYRMVAFGEYADDDTASALKRRDYKDSTDLVTEESVAVDCRNNRVVGNVSGCIQAKPNGGYSLNYQNPVLVPNSGNDTDAFHISRGKADEVVVSPTLMAGTGPNRHGTGYSGTDFTAIVEKADPECYPIDIRNATRTTEKSEMNRQGLGIGSNGDPSPTLTNVFIPAIAVEDANV